MNIGEIGYAGYIGYNWSSLAAAFSSTTSAASWWFEFTITASRPSWGPGSRWGGLPLCCLFRGGRNCTSRGMGRLMG